MQKGLIKMPGYKSLIGNKRPGFYSDKYGSYIATRPGPLSLF